MHIAINCRSFSKKQYAGIGRYAYHLVKSLSAIDHENRYSLYLKKRLFNFERTIPSFNRANFVAKIDRFNHGEQKALKDCDLYHLPGPDHFDLPDKKIVVTVHDLVYKMFPEGHTPDTIDATQRQLEGIIQKADKIICCSDNTLKDLQKHFPVAQDKTAVIHQGVDKDIFYPLKSEERKKARKALKAKGINEPFLLFVGTIEPRKNLGNLLRAFVFLKEKKKFNGKLVVVGMQGWMSEGINGLIEKLGLQKDVIFPGYVTNDELRDLYNLCEVFVFPSFYEGFGFPIVEAFSCGAAVVTSNISSCPEIAGGAALLIDPYQPRDIADKIARILGDPQLKEDLRKKGLGRAKEFSFEKTARRTLDVYKQVYAK